MILDKNNSTLMFEIFEALIAQDPASLPTEKRHNKLLADAKG